MNRKQFILWVLLIASASFLFAQPTYYPKRAFPFGTTDTSEPGDVNQDGNIDIILASNKVYWFENDGNENFTQHILDSRFLNYAIEVFIDDLNGDGLRDIMFCSLLNFDIYWYRNDGGGSFTRKTISTNYRSPHSIYTLDWNNDGHKDLITTSATNLKVITIWVNDGNENFTQNNIITNFPGRDAFPVDIDGDGDTDIIGGADNRVDVFIACTGTDGDGDNFGDDCDCDDLDATVYPGADEILDGKDNNCNGFTDCIDPDVIDDVPPTLDCPQAINREVSSACQVLINYGYTINDNCDLPTPRSVIGYYPVGVTPVTHEGQDLAGNTATCSFNITVVDIAAPSLNCPTGTEVRNSDPGMCDHTAFDLDPTVTNNCDIQSLINDYNQSNTLNGEVFPKGKTLVSWLVIDQDGNSSTCSYNIKIRDREAPVFDNCPDDSTIIVPFNSGGSYYSFPVLSATDNCNSANKITISGFPLSGSFCAVGVTSFNWTATDKANNVGHCNFDVTVQEAGSPAPSGWTNNTVGNGNACQTNYDAAAQSLIIQSAGGNVSATSDNFCGITIPNTMALVDFRARVTPAGTGYYDQAGIMMRQSLAANSPQASMILTGTKVPLMTYRFSSGGFPLSTPGTAVSSPYWLRLYRLGATITGHISADGTNWTQIASYPNVLGSSIYLVLFSTTAGPSGQATFDNITINGVAPRLGVESVGTELSLRAYPNPFSENLFIEVENALPGETYHVRLSNVLGQRVYGYETGASAVGTIKQRISLEHLPAGTYLLEVSAGVQRKAIKVQKF